MEATQSSGRVWQTGGRGARSRPKRGSEAENARCSKGSTVGPIDDDQLYYLESRGVQPEDAERLIVIGFFEDVLVRLPVPALGSLPPGRPGQRWTGARPCPPRSRGLSRAWPRAEGPAETLASVWRVTLPSRESGDAITRRRPRISSLGKGFCS